MDVSLKWVSGKHFRGLNSGGLSVSMDASKDHGGEENGPSPMEMIALGVGGCTGMDVIEMLKKMRQDVTGFEIEVHVVRAEEHPKVFKHILIVYRIYGNNVDEKNVARAVELSRDKYCSGIAMMRHSAQIETRWSIHPPVKG